MAAIQLLLAERTTTAVDVLHTLNEKTIRHENIKCHMSHSTCQMQTMPVLQGEEKNQFLKNVCTQLVTAFQIETVTSFEQRRVL